MGLLFVRRIRLQVAVCVNHLLAAALPEQLILGANVGVLLLPLLPLRFLPRLLVGALVVIHLAGLLMKYWASY